jgi:hypothetical protein
MKDRFSLAPERRLQCAEASAKAFCEEFYAQKKRDAEEEGKRRLEAEQDEEAERERKALEEAEVQKRHQLWLEFLAKFAPKANIYIRPAIPSDVEQITAIYNYYVLNSIQADDLEETSVNEWSG